MVIVAGGLTILVIVAGSFLLTRPQPASRGQVTTVLIGTGIVVALAVVALPQLGSPRVQPAALTSVPTPTPGAATEQPARSTLVGSRSTATSSARPPSSPPPVTASTSRVTVPLTAAVAQYVALGDSYAAGIGAGDSSDGACARSSNAYPTIWAAAHPSLTFTSGACAGATVASVADHQLSALSSATSLISITVGGNDAGYVTVMSHCVLHANCIDTITSAEAAATATLPGQLTALYRNIHARAPHANILVLGYPTFYDAASTRVCLGLSHQDRAKINEAITALNAILRSAAQSSGVRYLDVDAAFTGHRLCDSSAWLHSLNVIDLNDSYHPTAAGQHAYAAVLSAAVA